MANWACLPHDLLVFTAGLLKKFVAAFGAVCKSWHAAANKDYFKELWLGECTPYLLLPARRSGNDDIRDFYSLSEGEIVASIRVRNSSKRKCFESLGWFLAIDEDGSMCLLDPFSKVQIPLPHQSFFPDAKCVRHPQEFIRRISARPGETSWYRIKTESGFYQDLSYHSGHFYFIDCLTTIRIFNFVEGNPPEGQVIARLVADRNSQVELSGFLKSIYITKTVEDSRLLVTRTYDEEDFINTIKFQVYEFYFPLSTLREIDNLGNMAIFVSSLNATTVVDASRFPGVVKAHHIYFMDRANPWESDCHLERVSGKDLGTYNLENGTIDPFYQEEKFDSKISRPTWFIPISWPLSY